MKLFILSLTGALLIGIGAFSQDEPAAPGNQGFGSGVASPGARFRNQGRMGRRGSNMGVRPDGMQQMLQALNLDEKQQEQLKNINKDHRRDMYKYKSTERDLNFELSELLVEKEFNESKVNSIVGKISENNHKMLQTRIELIKKIRGVLRKEQIEKMNFQLLWNAHGRGFQGRSMQGPRGGNRQGQREGFGGLGL